MKKETAFSILLIVVGITIGLTARYLDKYTLGGEFLSPFSDSFSVFSLLKSKERPKYIVYGFLPYWRLDDTEFLQLENLTDIAYFGLNINPDGTFLKINEEGETDPGYNNWKNNQKLKKLITSSRQYGVRFSLTVISHVAETSDSFLTCGQPCWDTFYGELIKELDEKGIKDVNLNFEYAEYTEGDIADKYTQFAKFINDKLDERYGDSYVVVSTFADSLVKPRVTKVQDLSKVVDALFIMAYDFHRPDSDTAGPVAPIGGAGKYAEYDLQTMLKDYLASMPPSKIIMGVPYYGYNWVVESHEPLSDRIPGNDSIGFSQSQSYSNIMDTILEVSPKIEWDTLSQSPYFTYVSPETGSVRQVYFENERSLSAKYDMIKGSNLAGVGIWALGYDGGYQELWKLLRSQFVF